MLNLRGNGCSLFVFIGLLSLMWAHDEVVSATRPFEEVILSDTELKYLNERLQLKDHLSRDDAINSILELEHFYTLLKNDERSYSPSAMVDLAWHQHILHTVMYSNFSQKHFNVDFVHHLPFWSGNVEIVEEAERLNPGKNGADATYEAIVELFGKDRVNATVWLSGKPGEHTTEEKEEATIENVEL